MIHRPIELFLALTLSCLVSLFPTGAAQAKQVEILIGDNEFIPQHLNIYAGDSIKWKNNTTHGEWIKSGTGCVPDASPFINAYLSSNGGSSTKTFSSNGTYPYFSDTGDHCEQGMTGSITVTDRPHADLSLDSELVLDPGDYNYGRVNILSGGKITLKPGHTHITVWGWGDMNYPDLQAFQNQGYGIGCDNSAGANGANGTSGEADTGQSGSGGNPGAPGGYGCDLTLVVYGNMTLYSGKIDLSGKNGGAGGDGGDGGSGVDCDSGACTPTCSCIGGAGGSGGNGGPGSYGGAGGNLRIVSYGNVVFNGSSLNPGVILDGGAGGGGGDGGSGGLGGESCDDCPAEDQVGPKGAGGAGAGGGTGGQGGSARIIAKTVSGFIRSRGGQGAGSGGVGAIGGAAGRGGNGGSFHIQAACGVDLDSVVVDGGKGGNGAGADKGGLGGRGGNAGTISIDTSTFAGALQAIGGAGGSGGDGEYVNCSCLCEWTSPTTFVCTDNSCTGGPGGSGGSGGQGGVIQVEAVTQDPGAATSVTGGAAGSPGSGQGYDCTAVYVDVNQWDCDRTLTYNTGGAGSPGTAGNATVDIIPAGTVRVHKMVDREYANPGDLLGYAIYVSGSGATDVDVYDGVPANTTFHYSDPLAAFDGSAVTWNLATVDACPSARTFQAVVNAGVPDLTEITNLAVAQPSGGPSSSSGPVITVVGNRPTPTPPKDPIEEDSLFGSQGDNPKVVDPVNPSIGNHVFEKTLISLPGKSLPVSFKLAYNSRDDYCGPLGCGWTHSYNIFLEVDGSEAIVKFGDGHREYFREDGIGGYYAVKCNTRKTLASKTGGGWELTQYNGVVYTFDTSGNLTSLTDLNGNQVTLTHTTRLDSITDSSGRQITFSYTADKLTGAAVTGTGVAVTMTHTGDDLTSFTDPNGNSFSFTYDASHRMLTETDGRGITVVTNTYDAEGRVVSQANALGQVTGLEYTPASGDRTQVMVSPPGGYNAFHYYDSDRQITSLIDPRGNQAHFTHDAGGRRTGFTDKKGGAASIGHDTSGNANLLTDRLGNTTQVTHGAHNLPTSVRDAMGQESSLTYDANGNLTGTTDPLGNSTSITYNADGQPLTITNPRGSVWTTTYNADGQVATSTSPLGAVVSNTYNTLGRRVTSTDSVTGVTTTYTHDLNGNLLSRTGSLSRTNSYTYNGVNKVLTSTFQPLSAVTSYSYDNLGRMYRIQEPLGGVWQFGFDTAGNNNSITDPDGIATQFAHDDSGLLTSTTDALGRTTTLAYDANGNLISVTNPAGQVTSYEYDAENRLTRSTVPSGGAETFTYDALGRIASQTDPLGQTSSRQYDANGKATRITYPDGSQENMQYDQAGNLTRITDARGNSWQFTYNAMGMPLTKTDPQGRSESFVYDALGRLTSRTDRNGQTCAMAYDAANRLATLTLPGGGGAVTYSYDAADHLTQMQDATETISWTYDKQGRKTSFTDIYGNTVVYTYTAAGRLQTMTYPGSRTVTYAYDTVGRLASVTDWAANQTSFQYDNLDRVTQTTLPNGTRKLYAYDSAGRLTSLTHQTAGGQTLLSHTYQYDDLGRITRKETGGQGVDGNPASSQATISYDAANRVLTRQSGGVTTTFSFDNQGRLASKTSGGVTITYAFDSRDRLISVGDGTNTTAYVYDPLGSRAAKTFNGSETRYLNDGGRILAKLNGSGSAVSYYVYAGTLLYRLDVSPAAPVYYHADERGDIRGYSNASGTLTGAKGFDPFGLLLGYSGTTDEYGFLGIYSCPTDENGLVHLQARYYDPELQRFIREDPAGLCAGLNLYAYTGGDPVNRVDPTGMHWRDVLDKPGNHHSEWWPKDVPFNPHQIEQSAEEIIELERKLDITLDSYGEAMKSGNKVRANVQLNNVRYLDGQIYDAKENMNNWVSNGTKNTYYQRIYDEKLMEQGKDPVYRGQTYLKGYVHNNCEVLGPDPPKPGLGSRIVQGGKNFLSNVGKSIKQVPQRIKNAATGTLNNIALNLQYVGQVLSMPLSTIISTYGVYGAVEVVGVAGTVTFVVVYVSADFAMQVLGVRDIVDPMILVFMEENYIGAVAVDNTLDIDLLVQMLYQDYYDTAERCDRKYLVVRQMALNLGLVVP